MNWTFILAATLMVASILAFGPSSPARADQFIPPADKDVCDLKGGVVTWDSTYKSDHLASPGALVCVPPTGYPKNHAAMYAQINNSFFCRAYTDENRDVYLQAGVQNGINYTSQWFKSPFIQVPYSQVQGRNGYWVGSWIISCFANSSGLYTVTTYVGSGLGGGANTDLTGQSAFTPW